MSETKAITTSLGERIRQKWFYSPWASVLTVGLGVILSIIVFFILRWALWDAVWTPNVEACKASSGACWGFVVEKWRLIVFGRYPYELQWRPTLATLIIMVMLVITAIPRFWHGFAGRFVLFLWVLAFIAFFSLMLGGIFGLSHIDADMWGGLPLTVVLTLIGMTASIPLGILLALGRRSSMPVISSLSTAYIEIARGVPLITVLFVAAFIFPLFLPEEMRVDPFWRVAIAITLFQAAYIAETVRGGLQTIPKGQFEAARSLGFNNWHLYTRIILPQALVAVIPAFVNSLLSCFMDTSLVTVVSMYDLTGSLGLALGDAYWRNYFVEGYVFIVLIYFSLSFVVSRYSQWLERYITGYRTLACHR